MKSELIYIHPNSTFRLTFFFSLIILGLISFIYIIVSIFLNTILLAIIIFTIGVPIISLFLGFIVYIITILYNIFAKYFGGIIIEKKNSFI